MYLNKLYSEPEGLFKTITFVNGVNFIYAKKSNPQKSKKSLNGVGKSLLLNLIDYCLLSSETEHIKSAKENNDLKEYYIVLEFEIDSKNYIIKRSFDTPNHNLFFGEKGELLKTFNNTPNDKELSKILCDLIFKNENYKGKYSNFWLRKLIPFFIKSQSSSSKVNFKDPIKFLHDNSKEEELIPLHLFLLGINNAIFYQNQSLVADIKLKKPALAEVKNLVTDKYGVKDIPEAESEIDKFKKQISDLERSIDSFKLVDQYSDVEKESNVLTEKIKNLWYENFNDKKRIESYENSFSLKDEINTTKVKNIYKELNILLANNIKRTLDEAIKFRAEIAKSREDFLAEEMNKLKESIKKRDIEISLTEEKRTRLFIFLSEKKAIKDLSEAYLYLSKKRDELNEIESKIKVYRDFKNELSALDIENAKIYAEIEIFSQKIQNEILEFRKIFFSIFDEIYSENKGEANFIFSPNKRKDSKIDMNVILPSNLSYGKNKGRTLIYDLSILINIVKKKINAPLFLIHDGIFDGMDKAHFVSLYEYLEQQSNLGMKFQYIITINEEGTLSRRFGNYDKVNPDKIESEAIITLTPDHPLFDKKWK